MKNYGKLLEYANNDIKNDKEIVIEAVKNCRTALMFTNNELRNDKEVVLEAVKNNGRALEYASEDLRNDKEIVLVAVKNNGRALEYASEDLRNDKEIVLVSVKNNGRVLEYASEDLRNDKEIVLVAVKNKGRALEYASEDLRNDKEIVFEAGSLQFSGENVRNCKETVLEFLKQTVKERDYNIFIHHEFELFKDREFVVRAARIRTDLLKHLREEFRCDRGIVLQAIEFGFNRGSLTFEELHESLRSDEDVVRAWLKRFGEEVGFYYSKIDRNLGIWGDRDFVNKALTQNGILLEYASEELKNDKEIVMKAIKGNRYSFKFIGRKFIELHDSDVLRTLKKCEGDVERTVMSLAASEKNIHSLLRNAIQGDFVNDDDEEQMKLDEWERYLLGELRKNSEMPSGFHSVEVVPDNEKREMEHLSQRLGNVEFKDLEIIRFLGEGVCASAYLCQAIGEFFVVKIYPQLSFSKPKVRNEQTKKDSIKLPYHKNVAMILNHKESQVVSMKNLTEYQSRWKDFLSQVSTFESGMVLMKYHRFSLNDFENGKRFYRGREIYQILKRIISGVCHLHSNMIVHRDLHSGNVFIDPDNGRVWIGDFGCALDLRGYKTKFLVRKDDQEKMFMFSSSGNRTMIIGGYSPGIAPEIKNSPAEDPFFNYEKNDLFSVGLLGQKMLTKMIVRSSYVVKFLHWDKLVKHDYRVFYYLSDFIEKLSKKSVDERIGFEKVETEFENLIRYLEFNDPVNEERKNTDQSEEEVEGEMED